MTKHQALEKTNNLNIAKNGGNVKCQREGMKRVVTKVSTETNL